jgi:osmotically inducible lipoprotein OsmB
MDFYQASIYIPHRKDEARGAPFGGVQSYFDNRQTMPSGLWQRVKLVTVFLFNLELFIMNLNKNFFTGSSAVWLVLALGLGGCAGMTAQEKGTATGAVIGGVAGSVVGGGVLGTAAGAAVGGVIGHEVTKDK